MAHAHTPHSLLAGQLLLTPENPPRTPPGLASWLCVPVSGQREGTVTGCEAHGRRGAGVALKPGPSPLCRLSPTPSPVPRRRPGRAGLAEAGERDPGWCPLGGEGSLEVEAEGQAGQVPSGPWGPCAQGLCSPTLPAMPRGATDTPRLTEGDRGPERSRTFHTAPSDAAGDSQSGARTARLPSCAASRRGLPAPGLAHGPGTAWAGQRPGRPKPLYWQRGRGHTT